MKQVAMAAAGLALCMTISHGDMDGKRIEIWIRELMPRPVRCQSTPRESLSISSYQTGIAAKRGA
jgi:hypothetical protein